MDKHAGSVHCDEDMHPTEFHLVGTPVQQSTAMHRVTITLFRSISMPAGFRRHFVGKTLRNVCYCDVA